MSPHRIHAIAVNTVREAVRNRVLYVLLFFALLLIGTGSLLSTLSYVERERILQDVGLAAIRLFGAAIAIFIGVGLIHKEVDRRTIYTVLSKPVSRAEFLVGKYLGLVATLWLQVAVMGLGFVVVCAMAGAPLHGGHAAAIGLAGIEVAVLVAIATLFSSFTTPMLSSLFSVGIYVVGHAVRDLRELGANSGSAAAEQTTAILYRLLPDLEQFNVTVQAAHAIPLSPAQIWLPVLYGLAWASVLLTLASIIFERRDFR